MTTSMQSEIRTGANDLQYNGMLELKKKCGVCLKTESKYTCPRCNLSYCSLLCYNSTKHAGCSESFYKDCFLQEMKSKEAVSTSEKLRILEMIKNLDEDCVDEAEVDDSLHSRLEGINLDDHDSVWEKLTADEQAEFLDGVKNGTLVDEWKPWWTSHEKNLVVELDESSVEGKCATSSAIPQLKLNVPKLTELLKSKEPSPLVSNNLVEVLYTYAYHCRKYNGTTTDLPSESGFNLISGSTFLLNGLTRPSLEEALEITMSACSNHNRDTAVPQETIEVLLDVYHILLGPDKDNVTLYAKVSLAECHSNCTALKRCRELPSTVNKTLVKNALRKFEFLYAWADHAFLEFPALALRVFGIYKSKISLFSEHEMHKMSRSHQSHPPVKRDLITEL